MLVSRIVTIIWVLFTFIYYLFSDGYLGITLLVLTLLVITLLLLNIVLLKDKLSSRMTTDGTVHKSETGALFIEVKNKSIIPVAKLRLHLQFINKLTGERIEKSFFVTINSRGKTAIPIQLSSLYCGHIKINVKTIQYYDFLGVFSRTVDVNESTHIYILPNVVDIEIEIIELEVGFQESHVYEVNRRGDDGLEIFGIREYEQEDSLKNIHWKLTSKFDELIVKELSQSVNYTFLILLDLTTESHNRNEPAVIDAMIESFVSTSEALLQEGYSHSIGWLDPKTKHVQIEDVYSKDHLIHLLKDILLLEQVTSDYSVLEAFSFAEENDRFSHIIQVASELTPHIGANLTHSKLTCLVCHSEQSKTVNFLNAVTYTPRTMPEKLQFLSI